MSRRSKAHKVFWAEAKIKRFVDAWNDYVHMDGLRERFDCKPGPMAAHLRKRGYNLVKRAKSS